MIAQPLQVIEYINHSLVREWDSLMECARYHRVSTETIKRLICNGKTLDDGRTFDIPCYCDMDILTIGEKLVIVDLRKSVKKQKKKRVIDTRNAVHQGSLCLPDGVAI